MSHLTRLTVIVLLAGLGRPAAADPFIVGELPAAMSVSDPQSDLFGSGVMPAVGVYLPVSNLFAFGMRLRAGVLADSSAMALPGEAPPDRGGLATIGLAARLRLGGGWIEVVGGGGITGSDAVRTVEAGIGWSFTVGKVGIGPSLRYLDVGARPGDLSYGDAQLVLAGVEVSFGDRKRPPRRVIERVAAAPVHVVSDGDGLVDVDATCATTDPSCGGGDLDGDGIRDADDKCPTEPETVNGVEDRDGCPDHGEFVVTSDRIVLEERVLFDVNRARIKRSGRPVIMAIAAAIAVHPEWTHLDIEGHADIRGPDQFNDWLSATRAGRVRAALIEAGVTPEQLSATGYGAHRPRDPGHSETAHARNRRVEFAIVRNETTEVLP